MTFEEWDESMVEAAQVEARDTEPAPAPTQPENAVPEHPFHAHLDGCTQCLNHPFNLCSDGAELLAHGAVRVLK